jgi:putative DNA-invertase from lambdoid prophage Rac
VRSSEDHQAGGDRDLSYHCNRLAPKVLALIAVGRSYRLISRELGLSKNTVFEIVKQNRAMSA